MASDNEELEIKPEDITYDELIGEGGCGQVKKAKHRTLGKVAVKTLRDGFISKEDQKELKREARYLMKVAGHNNILHLYGIIVDKTFAIVLPYMPFKDVGRFTICFEIGTALKMNIARQILEGMIHIHKSHVHHLDLKAENVLINNHFDAMIGDFGLARLSQTAPSLTQTLDNKRKGTYSHIPPELMADKEHDPDYPEDVYMFAITLWQIFTPAREQPYRKMDYDYICNKVKGGGRPAIEKVFPGEIRSLIELCWKQNPAERATFQEVKTKFDPIYEKYRQNVDSDKKKVRQQIIEKYPDKTDERYECTCHFDVETDRPAESYFEDYKEASLPPAALGEQAPVTSEAITTTNSSSSNNNCNTTNNSSDNRNMAENTIPKVIYETLVRSETNEDDSLQSTVQQSRPTIDQGGDRTAHNVTPDRASQLTSSGNAVSLTGSDNPNVTVVKPDDTQPPLWNPEQHNYTVNTGSSVKNVPPEMTTNAHRSDFPPMSATPIDVPNRTGQAVLRQQTDNLSQQVTRGQGSSNIIGQRNSTNIAGQRSTFLGQRSGPVREFLGQQCYYVPNATSVSTYHADLNNHFQAMAIQSQSNEPFVRNQQSNRLQNPPEQQPMYGVYPSNPAGQQPMYRAHPNNQYTGQQPIYGAHPNNPGGQQYMYGAQLNNPAEQLPLYGTHPNNQYTGQQPIYVGHPNDPVGQQYMYGADQGSGQHRQQQYASNHPVTPTHSTNVRPTGTKQENRGSNETAASGIQVIQKNADGTETIICMDRASSGLPPNMQLGNFNKMIVNMGSDGSRHDTDGPSSIPQTQCNLTDLTTSESRPTRDQIDIVAVDIGSSWKRLCRKLGADDPEIECLQHDHGQHGVYELCYQGIRLWQQRAGDEATVRVLARALWEIGRADIAMKL